jgi:hypothetical protein
MGCEAVDIPPPRQSRSPQEVPDSRLSGAVAAFEQAAGLEALDGFEPSVTVLQTDALPLGYSA